MPASPMPPQGAAPAQGGGANMNDVIQAVGIGLQKLQEASSGQAGGEAFSQHIQAALGEFDAAVDSLTGGEPGKDDQGGQGQAPMEAGAAAVKPAL